MASAGKGEDLESTLRAYALAGDAQAVEPLLGVLGDIGPTPWYATLADHLNHAANPDTLANAKGGGVLNRR